MVIIVQDLLGKRIAFLVSRKNVPLKTKNNFMEKIKIVIAIFVLFSHLVKLLVFKANVVIFSILNVCKKG